jgi:hypothetical protein
MRLFPWLLDYKEKGNRLQPKIIKQRLHATSNGVVTDVIVHKRTHTNEKPYQCEYNFADWLKTARNERTVRP